MAWIHNQFDRYLLSYRAGGGNLVACLSCYTSSPWQYVGRLVFYADHVPPNATSGENLPSLHFSAAQFNDVIDILRYEKPLFLRMDTDTLSGDLATSSEEIGEQEP
ncbi:MAG: hypothetical protein QNJ22_15140 [Desulfosarcinaceae bacterium]|nr:hypothetical protein [Desulfosarcinaceae bacterium]